MLRKRRVLLFFNVPMMAGIPCWIEFGNFTELVAEKAEKAINMLIVCDIFLVFNSFVLYAVLQKICTKISYLPDDDKIKIK